MELKGREEGKEDGDERRREEMRMKQEEWIRGGCGK